MRLSVVLAGALLSIPAVQGLAQSWEAGGAGGFGFANNVGVSNPVGSASTGLGQGASFGGVITHHSTDRVSGEIRYTYRQNALELSSTGNRTTFSGLSHLVHYDVLVHAAPRRAKVRPFVAAGGGVRVFRGTGREAAFQPLEEFAILTRTQELKPLISVGGGTSIALSNRVALRLEVRDYITPFPRTVIAPSPGSSIKGWLHDIVPLVGLSFRLDGE